MSFITPHFLWFFVIIFFAYWIIKKKEYQNLLLLIGSYVFYGWIEPWFCLLIFSSTFIDYWSAQKMGTDKKTRKKYLYLSLTANLGMLGFFKYFNFFAENVQLAFNSIGFHLSSLELNILLPVGISFYTFQSLSYTIDVYRGKLEARKNFIDFALYVSFFPQLVAGPIERAVRFLPQIEKHREFTFRIFDAAIPLIISGYFKKLVVADNVAVFVDKVFMLESPSLLLLSAGSLAFAIQIFADFSAYTDLARGFARLLGFELIENFNRPYLAHSPSDFWKRWHISFSSWIQDYLYIPLGGSHVSSQWKALRILLISMGLSGLWHGAQWNFVIWGIYHAIILFSYRFLGFGGRWKPSSIIGLATAQFAMFSLTLLGWFFFRMPSLQWVHNVFASGFQLLGENYSITSAFVIISITIAYSLPLLFIRYIDSLKNKYNLIVGSVFYALLLLAIVVFSRNTAQDFIYFQF